MKRTIANMLIKLANRLSPPAAPVHTCNINVGPGPGFGTVEFRNELAQAAEGLRFAYR